MRRAILLDALGTLAELEPPAPRLREVLAARHGVQITEAEAECAIAAEIAYYRSHLDEGRDADSLAALRRRCAQALREALPAGAPIARVTEQELTDALLSALRFRPFEDAKSALDHARSRGLRLVVVSNWDVSLHAVLEQIGLAPLLDGVVTSAEIHARKPSPAIFEHALALAGVKAREALHVGDNFEEDVVGARAAGLDAILLRRDGSAGPDGVQTIASLAQLA